MKRAVFLAAWAIAALATGSARPAWAADDERAPFTPAQRIYLEHCGGCHGIQGHSAPTLVPSLQGQIGYFLCLPEGRDYLIQLPSVAAAPVSSEALADLMNFVVFDLGGPAELNERALRYTQREVSALRERPLKDVALAAYRAQLVERMIRRCGAPESLREYSSAQSR